MDDAINPLREGMPNEQSVQPTALVIFGASGDLTKRKLFPAIYNLALSRLLPEHFAAVGVARRPKPDSLCRWRDLVEPVLEEDAARLHRRFTAILYAATELARRARSGPRTDDRLFTSYLIDVVAAILGAPVSEETRRLADERDAARR